MNALISGYLLTDITWKIYTWICTIANLLQLTLGCKCSANLIFHLVKLALKIRCATMHILPTHLATDLLWQANIRMHNHMACYSLLTTSYSLLTTTLLQVVNSLDASWLSNLGLPQVVSTNCNKSAMVSCNKADFNRLVATWWDWQVCCKLLTSCNKPIRLTACNKSAVF